MNPKAIFRFRNVLLVGEGNFTFTTALIKSLSDTPAIAQDISLTSTSLDERDHILERYLDQSDSIFKTIDDCPFCSIFHGIDATNLQRHFNILEFDLVVFNFPHHEGKGKIQKNRKLMEDFFKCAVSVLQNISNSGCLPEIQVTLARGQGGTEKDEPQRDWGNSWQVVEQAARAGLVLKSVEPFESELWHALGYRCCGRRSQGKGAFSTEGALVHTFVREKMGVPCLYPVQHVHDISFWYAEIDQESFKSPNLKVPEFDEDRMFKLIDEVTLGLVQSITFQEIYISPNPNESNGNHKVSRSYRLIYCAQDDRALSRQKTVVLQLILRDEIENLKIGSFKC